MSILVSIAVWLASVDALVNCAEAVARNGNVVAFGGCPAFKVSNLCDRARVGDKCGALGRAAVGQGCGEAAWFVAGVPKLQDVAVADECGAVSDVNWAVGELVLLVGFDEESTGKNGDGKNGCGYDRHCGDDDLFAVHAILDGQNVPSIQV